VLNFGLNPPFWRQFRDEIKFLSRQSSLSEICNWLSGVCRKITIFVSFNFLIHDVGLQIQVQVFVARAYVFCLKFVAVCRKIATFCISYFFTHDVAGGAGSPVFRWLRHHVTVQLSFTQSGPVELASKNSWPISRRLTLTSVADSPRKSNGFLRVWAINGLLKTKRTTSSSPQGLLLSRLRTKVITWIITYTHYSVHADRFWLLFYLLDR